MHSKFDLIIRKGLLAKLFLSLALALICCTPLFAQQPTKSQTIRWIIEKLSAYGRNMNHSPIKMYYDAEVDEFVIMGETGELYKNHKYETTIPIGKIDNIEFDQFDETMIIRTVGQAISTTIEKDVTNSNLFTIRIDYASEGSLFERMRKAVKRLYDFYEKEEEAF